MSGGFRTLLALVAVLTAAFAASPSGARTHEGRTLAARDAVESGLLVEINALRRQHGLAPLRLNVKLRAAADAHSSAMASRGFFSHSSPDGTIFWKRVARFYPQGSRSYWSVGENLLWSTTGIGATAALKLWMESPGHRKNILTPHWREVGLSAVTASAVEALHALPERRAVAGGMGEEAEGRHRARVRVCGRGERQRESEGHEPVGTADLVQLAEQLPLQLVRRAERLHGLTGRGRRAGAGAQEHDDGQGCEASCADSHPFEIGPRNPCFHPPKGGALESASIRFASRKRGGAAQIAGSGAPGGSGGSTRRCRSQSTRSTCTAPATGIAARAPITPASSAPISTAIRTASGES